MAPESNQQNSPEAMRSYAERSLGLRRGEKTEDELLQRIWNLSGDVTRLVEQLETAHEALDHIRCLFHAEPDVYRDIARKALGDSFPASAPDLAATSTKSGASPEGNDGETGAEDSSPAREPEKVQPWNRPDWPERSGL